MNAVLEDSIPAKTVPTLTINETVEVAIDFRKAKAGEEYPFRHPVNSPSLIMVFGDTAGFKGATMNVRHFGVWTLCAVLSPSAFGQNPLVLPLNFPDWVPMVPSGRPPALIEPGTKRVTEPAAYPPNRTPESSLSTTSPQGETRVNYFDRNGTLIGSDDSTPYLGSPTGYRTATTRHFDANRQQIGVSHVTLHANGYARTTHWDNFGKLTGYTIEDWLGRRTEYDPTGKWLQTTTAIAPLYKQMEMHPAVALSDGIDSVKDPRSMSAQALSVDLTQAAIWAGVSVATLIPNGAVLLQHYDRSGFRTGASGVAPAIPRPGNRLLYRADHFDPRYFRAGRTDMKQNSLGRRDAVTYDPFGRPTARTVTTPGGSSFRYNFAGRLIGTSQ